MVFRKFILALSLIVFSGTLSGPLGAEISIPRRAGNLSITTPEGQLIRVAPKDTLPNLVSGSVVEVLSGNAEFNLDGTGFITLIAGESVMNLVSGTQVLINVTNNGADTLIKVVNGEVEVSLGETILAIQSGGVVQASVSEGKAVVELSQGDASILELNGDQTQLLPGHSYSLGSIIPSFEDGFF